MTCTKALNRRSVASFPWLSVLLPVLVLVAFDTYLSFHPESDFGMALLLIALGLFWVLLILFRIALALWRELPKKALLLGVGLVCLWPASTLIHRLPIGAYIHLAWAYSEYETQIKAAPGSRIDFDWGIGGWAAGPGFQRTLVYDPADKVLMENNIKDAQLRVKYRAYTRDKQEYSRVRLITKKLFGHFYLVEELTQA